MLKTPNTVARFTPCSGAYLFKSRFNGQFVREFDSIDRKQAVCPTVENIRRFSNALSVDSESGAYDIGFDQETITTV